MAQNEEELNQLKYLYNVYTQEYETVREEMNSYMMVSAAFARNMEALNKIKTMENTNMLVGLDAGTFLEVHSKGIKSVITNVGAGYLVEKNVDDAKTFVESNSQRLQGSIAQLMAQKQKLEKEILDLSYKIGEMEGPHQH